MPAPATLSPGSSPAWLFQQVVCGLSPRTPPKPWQEGRDLENPEDLYANAENSVLSAHDEPLSLEATLAMIAHE
jgi:hypothetical protein